MQINRTGYFLFAFFGLGGLAFMIAGILIGGRRRPRRLCSSAESGSLVTVGLVIYALSSNSARAGTTTGCGATACAGTGTLVSAGGHVEINEQPQLKMVLDLEIPGMEPRRVERKVIVSNFASPLMQPGLVLPVYVNPSDPEDILIAW